MCPEGMSVRRRGRKRCPSLCHWSTDELKRSASEETKSYIQEEITKEEVVTNAVGHSVRTSTFSTSTRDLCEECFIQTAEGQTNSSTTAKDEMHDGNQLRYDRYYIRS